MVLRRALAGWLPVLILALAPLAARDYYIYVAAESEDEVLLIKFDGQVAKVVKQIPVGVWPLEIEGPHGLTISPDGDYWYLSMAHGIPNGHVYRYSTGDDQWSRRVELNLFPATLEISVATGLLYVVNFNLHGDHVPSYVSVVDPESMIEIERIQTGVMPHGSRLSNDGLRHYSVAMMDAMLYEIDAVQLRVSRTLYLGKGPQPMDHESASTPAMPPGKTSGKAMSKMPGEKPTWVYPAPDDRHIYVVNNGTDEVLEIDLQTWAISRRFKTGRGPYNCEVSRDGKILAVTYKSEGKTALWDLASGKEVARITNTRKVTHGVVISPDSRYAFVSVEGIGGEPGSLDVIDIQTGKMVSHTDTGKQAGGIAFWKMED